MESHLLQMRGLKRGFGSFIVKKRAVASFTDAWIETSSRQTSFTGHPSHLLQMRGLKQQIHDPR